MERLGRNAPPLAQTTIWSRCFASFILALTPRLTTWWHSRKPLHTHGSPRERRRLIHYLCEVHSLYLCSGADVDRHRELGILGAHVDHGLHSKYADSDYSVLSSSVSTTEAVPIDDIHGTRQLLFSHTL
ncbi:hypothetical protein OG21DRAFT_336619 [Imleria badia]|nr:hypothetical protein OG21DRAFT_336619 [Imleria badia]